jgi:hypothetical protein
MRVIISALLCFGSVYANAQDLTGIWRGHFKSANISKLQDSLGDYDVYKFETQIEQNNKEFKGVTYSYHTTVFYGKASCYGAINPKTKKVLLEENKLIEVQSVGGSACLMTLFLQYSKVGKEEFLEGTFTAMEVRDSTACPGGTVFLRKVPTSDFYKEPFLVEKEKEKEKTPPPVAKATPPPPPAVKKTTAPKSTTTQAPKKSSVASAKTPVKKAPAKKPAVPPKADHVTTPSPRKTDVKQLTTADTFEKIAPRTNIGTPVPRVLETRVNELVRTITTAANDVYVKIYDNGSIDNDTVSVYVNNKLIISKQRLTDKAITVKISLEDKDKFHELVMVAENLGEIPPNTSLMIVNAGDQQYEVRITSNEQKNAVVRFKRE